MDEMPLLVSRNGDTYYLGPLNAGMWLVGQDRWAIHRVNPHGTFEVLLCDREGDPDSAAEWGRGPTPEVAWRFAIGAACGPVDDEYDEAALRAALAKFEG